MAPTLNDVIRVVAKMSQAANDIQNVYHMLITSGVMPSGGTLRDDIISFISSIYDYIDYGISDNVSFDTIAVYNLTQDEYYGEDVWDTLTVGGGTTNNMLPPQCAPLVLFPTATPGIQGKKFLPPTTDTVTDDNGSVQAGFLTNMALYGADLVSGMGTGTYNGAFGVYRPATALFTPYSSAVARDLYATQRRRYTGRGS